MGIASDHHQGFYDIYHAKAITIRAAIANLDREENLGLNKPRLVPQQLKESLQAISGNHIRTAKVLGLTSPEKIATALERFTQWQTDVFALALKAEPDLQTNRLANTAEIKLALNILGLPQLAEPIAEFRLKNFPHSEVNQAGLILHHALFPDKQADIKKANAIAAALIASYKENFWANNLSI